MKLNLKPINASLCGLFLASLSTQAETILWLDDGSGGEKQDVNLTAQDSLQARSVVIYEKGTHLADRPFNVGDTLMATFTVSVDTNSVDPSTIPYANSASLAFGINDVVSEMGVGFTFDLTGTGPRVRTGYDLSVTSGGNFGHLSSKSGSWVNGTVDSENFLDLNDTAELLFTVTKTATDATGDALELRVQWGSTLSLASHSIPTSVGMRIDTIGKFLVRANALGAAETAKIQLDNFEAKIVDADSLVWLEDGSVETRSVTNTVTDAGQSARTRNLLTAGTHLGNQVFNVGDRLTASYTVTVAGNSADPSPIPWLGNASIAFAVNDEDAGEGAGHAVGMTFDLTGTERVRVGYDLTAPGAGNFGTLSSTSGSWVSGTVESEKFLMSGDTADLVFTVDKVSADGTGGEYVLTLQWGTTPTPITHTITTDKGVNIDTIDKFLFRINALDGAGGEASANVDVSNYQSSITPIPVDAAPLEITSIVVNPDDSVTLIWTSEAAATYALDLGTDLATPTWSEQNGAIASGGATTEYTVPAVDVLAAAPDGYLFFQVRKP